jgi:hypothetical protein
VTQAHLKGNNLIPAFLRGRMKIKRLRQLQNGDLADSAFGEG